jgi:hypothetical protein
LILTYAADAGVNIIVLGEFNIIKDDIITVKIMLYSVAQLKIVDDFTLTGSVEDSFKLVNKIALTSSDKFVEKQDELQITLEEIREQVRPANYIKEPQITDISIDGVVIEWKTDKETLSSLYIGESNDFNMKNAISSYTDESTDAINHYIVIDYDSIDVNKEYFFKTKETDFFDNETTSNIYKIEEGMIYNELIKDFQNLKDTLSKEISQNVKNNLNLEKSLQSINKLIVETTKYNKVLELDEHIKEQEEIKKIIQLLIKAEEDIKNKSFEASMVKYNESLDILKPLEIYTDIITERYLIRLIEKAETASKVIEIVAEADKSVEDKDYRTARTKYNKVIHLVKKYDIENYIEFDYIKSKMDSIPETLFYFYINTSLGSSHNFMSDNGIRDTMVTNWSLNFNFRSNRLLSYGVGLDLFSIEAFAKISPLNSNALYFYTNEFYLKGGILIDFLSEIISTSRTGIGVGANIAAGYIWSFEKFGISTELKLWSIYFIGGVPYDRIPINISISLGFVYNFGEYLSG